MGQTDGWTDTQPLHRPCSSYYAGGVNNDRASQCLLCAVMQATWHATGVIVKVLFCVQGIVRALREYQKKLIDGNVSIFVRRAGPNYQEGLRIMRELGKIWQPYVDQ